MNATEAAWKVHAVRLELPTTKRIKKKKLCSCNWFLFHKLQILWTSSGASHMDC